jgi:hypothetical protein
VLERKKIAHFEDGMGRSAHAEEDREEREETSEASTGFIVLKREKTAYFEDGMEGQFLSHDTRTL